MKSILFVDDDAQMCAGLQKQLSRFGYHVETARCIDDGYQRALTASFSMILTDLMIGDEDGTMFVSQLRAAGFTEPIAIYTVHDSDLYAMAALRGGADDYILKTISIGHLAARVHAHTTREVRRAGAKPVPQRRVALGRFVLDLQAHTLEGDEKLVKLTERQTRLIHLLSQKPNQTFTCQQLLDSLWGNSYSKSESALHGMIKRLRQKLERECCAQDMVENEYGRGFRFVEEAVAHQPLNALPGE